MKIYEKLLEMINNEIVRIDKQYANSAKTAFGDKQWINLHASLDILAEEVQKNSNLDYMNNESDLISNNMYEAAKQVREELFDSFSGVVIGSEGTVKNDSQLLSAFRVVAEAYEDAQHFIKSDENENTK